MGRSLVSPPSVRSDKNIIEPKLEAASSASPTPPPNREHERQQQTQPQQQQLLQQPPSPQQQQQLKRQLELDDGSSPSSQQSRPKRRATNAHKIRFLQTRNPNKLEEEDLKRALEASLEEHPDYWPAEDTASWSSSDQSNAPSASSNSSSTGGGRLEKDTTSAKTNLTSASMNNITTTTTNATNTTTKRRSKSSAPTKRGLKNSSAMQHNHLFSNICNCQHAPQTSNYQSNPPTTSNCSATTNCCPMSSVHNRYKPVSKKNIYSESDFFHDGIMEYIEYELYRRGVLGTLTDLVDES